MKISKLRLFAYSFFVLQIFLYIFNSKNYGELLLQLNNYNTEVDQVSNTGFNIGTFIALTFFFWVGLVLIYFEKKRDYKNNK